MWQQAALLRARRRLAQLCETLVATLKRAPRLSTRRCTRGSRAHRARARCGRVARRPVRDAIEAELPIEADWQPSGIVSQPAATHLVPLGAAPSGLRTRAQTSCCSTRERVPCSAHGVAPPDAHAISTPADKFNELQLKELTRSSRAALAESGGHSSTHPAAPASADVPPPGELARARG